MTFVTIRVGKPANRLIYIDGNYAESDGNSSTQSFTVETGDRTFETLTSNKAVDYRRALIVVKADDGRTLTLDRIDPPEPI